MNNSSVLIIDDEDQIRKLLTITLQSNSYAVKEASNGNEGLKMSVTLKPDLVLLDLGLPDISGHEVLIRLREWYVNPVIIISAQNNEDDVIKALDSGANDYITKPFRTLELLARIRSQLSKSGESQSNYLAFEGLTIDFTSRTVTKNGGAVKLTVTEFSLLALLLKNEGKVLTHRYLLINVWGPSDQNELQYLRVFIAQLRKKIEDDPNRPIHIITESGIGYRFIGFTKL
jgi:two-component system, OmpR family, KDP operon response regulator KdpE